MRTRLKNSSEVCHVWAQQTQPTGKCSNVFFTDRTIYSYGHHFPMARFIGPKTVLITTRGYSVTTSRHIHEVRGAVSHLDTIDVRDVEAGMPDAIAGNVAELLESLRTELKTIATTKKFDIVQSRVANHWANITAYLKVSKFKPAWFGQMINYSGVKEITSFYRQAVKANGSLKLLGVPDETVNKAKLRQANHAVMMAGKDERDRAREAERRRVLAIETAGDLEKWKNGEQINRSWWHLEKVFLRVKGEEIETTKGASIPLTVARKLWARLNQNHPDIDGMSLGHYTVNSFDGATLTAGCHKIELVEIQRLAKILGW